MQNGIEESGDDDNGDEFLTSVQAGRLLGVGAERMRQIANAGEVPVMYTPLGRLFRMRDIEELIERRGEWAGRWFARLPARIRRKLMS